MFNAGRQSLVNALKSMPLANTGSDCWHRLWEAARDFSNTDSYPAAPFPFTGSGARCVLCQQPLSHDGAQRLQELARHVQATADDDYQREMERHDGDVARMKALSIAGSFNNTIDELALDQPDVAANIRRYLKAAERHREAVLVAVEKRTLLAEHGPMLDMYVVSNYRDSLLTRSDEIISAKGGDEVDALRLELTELEARKVLSENIEVVLREITRRQRIAVYEQCIRETRTNSITRKNTDVTKRAVTGQLVSAFSKELKILGFDHVEVELAEAGGSRGSLYHKLMLTRAPGAEVDKVVSEGEARCLSIASFFAELSTADDLSAILFDDPVSSLDHSWRYNVAKRLAAESVRRQVIVYTHDLVFWHALRSEAQKLGVSCDLQYVRRTVLGAGALSDNVPSPATTVSRRVGQLNERWQKAEKLSRTGQQDSYEVAGRDIYGMLREAWERGVEETLLDGVVERYRHSVQTDRKIMNLADINEEDCRAVQNSMTKCSTHMRGHDISAADNPPFPNPEEIKDDIEAFDSWIKGIKRRRKR